MERATEPDDLVDCVLYLCNGNLKFQPVPKQMLDWLRKQIEAGNREGFIITVDNIPYKCKDIFFRFFTDEMCPN